jgi:hypothetical protein
MLANPRSDLSPAEKESRQKETLQQRTKAVVGLFEFTLQLALSVAINVKGKLKLVL